MGVDDRPAIPYSAVCIGLGWCFGKGLGWAGLTGFLDLGYDVLFCFESSPVQSSPDDG